MDRKTRFRGDGPNLLTSNTAKIIYVTIVAGLVAACAENQNSYATIDVPALKGGIVGRVSGNPPFDVNEYRLFIGKSNSLTSEYGFQHDTVIIEAPDIGNGYIAKTLGTTDKDVKMYNFVPVGNISNGRVQNEILTWSLVGPNESPKEDFEKVIGTGFAGVNVVVKDFVASGSTGAFPFHSGNRTQAIVNSDRTVRSVVIGNGNPTQHSIQIEFDKGNPADYVVMYPQQQTQVAQIYAATVTPTTFVPTEVPTVAPTGVPLVAFPDVNVEIKPTVAVESDLALGIAGIALTAFFIASSIAYLWKRSRNSAVRTRDAALQRGRARANHDMKTQNELQIYKQRYKDANDFRHRVIRFLRERGNGTKTLTPPPEPQELPD